MGQRVNIQQSNPDAYAAAFKFAAIVSRSALSPIHRHLIKIRASQINSCVFCINMHTKEALRIGETKERIFLLSAWKEADIFTEEEKAILAITEEVTLIHREGISEKTYNQAEQFFTPEMIGEIILETVLINLWNRIAISSRLGVHSKISVEPVHS